MEVLKLKDIFSLSFYSSIDVDDNKKQLDDTQIEFYLEQLNNKLKEKNVIGEIDLVGGAVMCLVFKNRSSTHDIDAIFEPKSIMYKCIEDVSKSHQLSKDWINDSVKGFLSEKAKFVPYKDYGNLSVKVATPEYMLAMKCLSARMDNENERGDISFLIKYLNLKSYDDVEKIILDYYDSKRFQAKTKYAIMEIIDEQHQN